MHEIIKSVRERSRYLRANQTRAELIFWEHIRKRRFYGLRFLRQYPIKFHFNNHLYFFIADFYCHELRLVIELDGEIHKRQKFADRKRSLILKDSGLRVIRIQNEAVFKNINGVLEKLEVILWVHGTPPNLPLERGGEKRRTKEFLFPS